MPNSASEVAQQGAKASVPRSAVATPSNSMKLPSPSTSSRWMRTPSQRKRRRSLRTSTRIPSVAASAAFSSAGSGTATMR